MTRWWIETLAGVSDVIPLPLLLLVLLVGAALLGLLWYTFPGWVPRRLPRWRLRWPALRPRRPTWRWRWPRWTWARWKWPTWRRRARSGATGRSGGDRVTDDGDLPDLPVAAFLSLADRFAAEGRYAEAVRERLRAMVRELVDRGVVEHRPGWTVTELAGAAATSRPAVQPPLGEAARIFSDIWYGLRPAAREHDARMRALTDEVSRAAAGIAHAESRS